VVRREHHADRGHHGVERVVVERQRLGVRLTPLELEAALRRGLSAGLEQLGRQVAGHDGGTGGSRRQGDVA
jgi:hypothetical protein